MWPLKKVEIYFAKRLQMIHFEWPRLKTPWCYSLLVPIAVECNFLCMQGKGNAACVSLPRMIPNNLRNMAGGRTLLGCMMMINHKLS